MPAKKAYEFATLHIVQAMPGGSLANVGLDDLVEIAPGMCSIVDAALANSEFQEDSDAARYLVSDLATIARAVHAEREGETVTIAQETLEPGEVAARARDLLTLLRIDPPEGCEWTPHAETVRMLIADRLEELIRSLGGNQGVGAEAETSA